MTDKETLNVTTNIESTPFSRMYYIVQALHNGAWEDVLFSRGNIKTATKKARHYRNKNDCKTRVIEVRENISYSYDYKLVTNYERLT